MTRPFRFGVAMTAFTTGEAWRRSCRRAEELGYDVLLVPDHLGMAAPFAALSAAAEVTAGPRLGTYVLNAGLWNPALLAREAATCDQLTGGRLELGLGAGYVEAEFAQAGLPFGSAGDRVDHLEHTVREVSRLLGDPGHLPRPAQRPVPLVIGGNGARVLRLAAGHAATTAFTGLRQAPGEPAGALQLISTGEVAERVTEHREAAAAHGRTVELNHLVQRVVVTGDAAVRRDALREAERFGAGLSENELLSHPALLIGRAEEIADRLRDHRERLGLSYFTVLGTCMETFAPVMDLLRG